MKISSILNLVLLITVSSVVAGCSKNSAVVPGPVALKVNPVAGPSAAINSPLDHLFSILGFQSAHAAVSTFAAFTLCNDTFIIKDVAGNPVKINGSATGTGIGLISVSPTATTALSVASFDIAAGTQVKEIYITSAVNPTLCGGAAYAVRFNPGSGNIDITQNTQFKFTYANPVSITGGAQELTVLFGSIINAMVGQGNGLTNSSIQTIAVSGTAL